MGDERNIDLSSTGSAAHRFQIKQSKRQFSKQYQLAGAGGIEPPNGGIKTRLIMQRFQSAFGKMGQNALQKYQ
ncbi:hypothetical protein [Bradyrhizobium sp. Arg816]|uniref:hypothetical protein n=1 Tax=Bradyrhizobium sp. Arg816 TaxID=2998491 RepID=UPI00249F677C|nr:hypothetical protein [Bradyrhizobium sp. Arg816]MDI3564012.1 hypothetical protein [Bradyrhizobium sp. Arg816]